MAPCRPPPLLAGLLLACATALPANGAPAPLGPEGAPAANTPGPAREDDATYRRLAEAVGAVVTVHARALGNARTAESLGTERSGAGVLIAPSGLVLTIGYLVLEADEVVVTDAAGHSIPASVVACDPATGFGLLRPIVPLAPRPIALGDSAPVARLDRLMVAGSGGVSAVTVVSRRAFAGYWEYLIDGAIFTAPPRTDHSGAALIDRDGRLVGIGSLLVMDAAAPGEQLPGNLFVPIDLLKPILGELVSSGRQAAASRPWIGVSSAEDDGHLIVMRVSEDGPADLAGIEAGDIILAVGEETVRSLAQFYRRLWSAGKPGVEVPLTVLHGADIRSLRVKSMDRRDFLRRKPTI